MLETKSIIFSFPPILIILNVCLVVDKPTATVPRLVAEPGQWPVGFALLRSRTPFPCHRFLLRRKLLASGSVAGKTGQILGGAPRTVFFSAGEFYQLSWQRSCCSIQYEQHYHTTLRLIIGHAARGGVGGGRLVTQFCSRAIGTCCPKGHGFQPFRFGHACK